MRHNGNLASWRGAAGGAACLFALLAGLAAMLAWHAAGAAGATAVGADAAPADDGPLPIATRPAGAATRAATSQPGKATEELLRKWRWYRITWTGNSIDSQSKSDQQLVDAMLKADPADLAALRALMVPEYERLAAAPKLDPFQCGRLASRIAVAWTRMPAGKDLSAVEVALNRRQSADEVCRWSLKALRHLAGDVPARYYNQYKSFVPGLAASMLSLIAANGTVIDQPGDLLDELVKIRPNIEKLAKADPDRQAMQEQIFQKMFAALDAFTKLQADKAAVLKLVADFRTAYNGRDGAAFVALWPEGHHSTAALKGKPFAEKIDPAVWTIIRWDPVYVVVQGDLAKAFVVSQYRTKDGKDEPVVLQGYGAKRHANEGWKLN